MRPLRAGRPPTLVALLAAAGVFLAPAPVAAQPVQGRVVEETAPVPSVSPITPRTVSLDLALSLNALQPSLSGGLTPSPTVIPRGLERGGVKLGSLSHIVFDVRGSRGGKGDVAAAYLTASDLIGRAKGAALPRITFVADKNELGILSGLSGRPVPAGGRLFDGAVEVVALADLARRPPADLYLALAAPDGLFAHASKLQRVTNAKETKKGSIPIDKLSGIVLNQTVLGNTESSSEQPATILVGGHRLEMSPAGVGPEESGVYADPVAAALRGRPRGDVRRHLLDHIPADAAGALGALRSYLEGRALRGAQPGLTYGVSLSSVKPQLVAYLKSLAAKVHRGKASYLIVSPSSITPDDIAKSPLLKELVVFVDPAQPLPKTAAPGRIYILRTGAVPHPVFVGLMAYARPPPIVAGDGALSAAIELGRPFVMTRIAWNQANVARYGERLLAHARAPHKRALIAKTFGGSDPEKGMLLAQYLSDLSDVFWAASLKVPVLTDTIINAVAVARRFASGESLVELAAATPDKTLLDSLVAARALEQLSRKLPALPPDDARANRPPTQGKKTAVVFENRTWRRVRIFSVSPWGMHVYRGELKPGERAFQASRVGETWLLSNALAWWRYPFAFFAGANLATVEGLPLAAFVADEEPGLAVIENPGSLARTLRRLETLPRAVRDAFRPDRREARR